MAKESSIRTIVAVGDIMLGEGVVRLLENKGLEQALKELTDILGAGDLILGNLESPITNRTKARKGQLYNFRTPASLAPVLSVFNGFALANNHILDFGTEGLSDTVRHLDELGIEHCGAGKNTTEAVRPAVFELDGFRVGMMAFTDPNWYPSGAASPGTCNWCGGESAELVKFLHRDTDFVIVHIHQGYEFMDYPGPEELYAARQAMDAGADLVIGHHSHSLMGVARERDALAAYGVGNFIFDNDIHRRFLHKAGRRAIFRFTASRHKVLDWSITPCMTDDVGWPVLAPGDYASAIRGHIETISNVLRDEKETVKRFRHQAGAHMLPHAFRSLKDLLRREGVRAVVARLARIRRVDVSVILSKLIRLRGKEIDKKTVQ